MEEYKQTLIENSDDNAEIPLYTGTEFDEQNSERLAYLQLNEQQEQTLNKFFNVHIDIDVPIDYEGMIEEDKIKKIEEDKEFYDKFEITDADNQEDFFDSSQASYESIQEFEGDSLDSFDKEMEEAFVKINEMKRLEKEAEKEKLAKEVAVSEHPIFEEDISIEEQTDNEIKNVTNTDENPQFVKIQDVLSEKKGQKTTQDEIIIENVWRKPWETGEINHKPWDEYEDDPIDLDINVKPELLVKKEEIDFDDYTGKGGLSLYSKFESLLLKGTDRDYTKCLHLMTKCGRSSYITCRLS